MEIIGGFMRLYLIVITLTVFFFIHCSGDYTEYFMQYNASEHKFVSEIDDIDELESKTYFEVRYKDGLKDEFYYYIDGKKVERAKINYQNDIVSEINHYSYKENNKEVLSKKEIFYEDVEPTQLQKVIDYNSSGTPVLERHYRNGRDYKEIRIDLDDYNKPFGKTVREYIYQEGRRLINSEKVFRKNVLVSRIDYTNKNGRKYISEKFSGKKLKTKTMYYTTSRENSARKKIDYNEDGDIVSVKKFFTNGNLKEHRLYDYSDMKEKVILYSKHGSITSEKEYKMYEGQKPIP